MSAARSLDYYKCSNGLDTATPYGSCVVKPTQPSGTPQELCTACLKSVRSLVDTAVNNTALNATTLPGQFYTWCTNNNYTMEACTRVKTAVGTSYNGNLARRAGSLCIRLGACSSAGGYTVSAPSIQTRTTTSNVTNSTTNVTTTVTTVTADTLTGALDTCAVEGVVSGAVVAGTYVYSSTGEFAWCCLLLLFLDLGAIKSANCNPWILFEEHANGRSIMMLSQAGCTMRCCDRREVPQRHVRLRHRLHHTFNTRLHLQQHCQEEDLPMCKWPGQL
jgi:hypothetical protein